jgi:acetylornithine deacetylase/succinyl-diaminopimelate desuccinylase-like protein
VVNQLQALGYAYNINADNIEVKGKAAHALAAEEGVNAIARLCVALRATGIESKAINFIADKIGEDPYARGIFGDCSDEISGRLRFNIGMIDIDGVEQISIDTRIPVTVPKEEIVAKLSTAAFDYGLGYHEHDWLAPSHVPMDHFIVKTLLKIYQEHSGDTFSSPRVSGGATYARALPNCVAFGALMPDEEITEHQPNERTRLENLYKAMEIFAYAVYELSR